MRTHWQRKGGEDLGFDSSMKQREGFWLLMSLTRFEILNEEEAGDYLSGHNNYFKLTAYRKNYTKHPDGKDKGKYIDLDFAYLVDIAVIDMQLRYRIVHMALDIEHHAKLQLLRKKGG